MDMAVGWDQACCFRQRIMSRVRLEWSLSNILHAYCLHREQEEHKIDKVFEGILQRLLESKPKDHLQFIIDSLTFPNPEDALQVGQVSQSQQKQAATASIVRKR